MLAELTDFIIEGVGQSNAEQESGKLIQLSTIFAAGVELNTQEC